MSFTFWFIVGKEHAAYQLFYSFLHFFDTFNSENGLYLFFFVIKRSALHSCHHNSEKICRLENGIFLFCCLFC